MILFYNFCHQFFIHNVYMVYNIYTLIKSNYTFVAIVIIAYDL